MLIDFLKDNYANFFYILNLVVLVLTLVILLRYASDTRRIADQTQETSLRPVILRSGFIANWNLLTPVSTQDSSQPPVVNNPLEFTILKNIAKDITGYIIVNHQKYQLLFGNDISTVDGNRISLQPHWGWMKPDTRLYAVFTNVAIKITSDENRIYVSYRDIEGNSYHTIEDGNFVQSTFKDN